MATFTHDAAPTQYFEADAIRFAYRRLGNPERSPLMFFHHFMGNHHDPALSDGSATDCEVISFINAGVASSTGLTPDTIEATARDAASFIDALGLTSRDPWPLDGRDRRPASRPRPSGTGAPPGLGRHRAAISKKFDLRSDLCPPK
jgi:pimeloyl-ACP methyl ester carboxylesterase